MKSDDNQEKNLKFFWKFSNFQNCEKWKKIQKIYFEYEFFKETYFHEFWRFFNNFLCKRKLRSCSKKFKSFLPPSLVFYPTFLALKFGQISRSKLIFTDIPTLKKWGKKLVRGVKNFCIIKCKHLTFICIKNQKKSIKVAEIFQNRSRKIELKLRRMLIFLKIELFLKCL